jgi:hypothetical protein
MRRVAAAALVCPLLLPGAVRAADAVLCYAARPAAGSAPFVRQAVVATDVVDGARSLDVSAPRRMCLPADLGSGVGQPGIGLRQYKAKRTRGAPPPSGDANVGVTNGLGAMRLERRAKPVALLVPAAFDTTTAPSPPGADLDRYRCDKARVVPGTAAPLGTILDLTDARGPLRVQIVKPTTLCTPVDAFGETIADAATALACFKVRSAPPRPSTPGVHVADALSATTVRLDSPIELCLPSRAIARCNGHAALCDRPFDAVSYATTHNAMSNREEGWFGPNQEYRIGRQLEDGVRALMLDTWYFDGDVVLCHGGDVLPCNVLGMKPLVDGLAEIEAFLARHPDEIVSIIFESYTLEADTAADVAASGLLARAHVQAVGAPWPTLRTLVETGKRLVVFTDRSDAVLPWHHYVWHHAFETHFSASTPADFSCARNRGSAGNPLFVLNHFLTQLIGSRELAEQVNHDPFFIDRALQCQAERAHLPNFVTVDFHDVGDVFAVVDRLNGVGTP